MLSQKANGKLPMYNAQTITTAKKLLMIANSLKGYATNSFPSMLQS